MRPNIDEVCIFVNNEINKSLNYPYLFNNKYNCRLHPHPFLFLGLNSNNGWGCDGIYLEKNV